MLVSPRVIIPPHVRSELAQKALRALHRTSKIEKGDLMRLANHLYQISNNEIYYRRGCDDKSNIDDRL